MPVNQRSVSYPVVVWHQKMRTRNGRRDTKSQSEDSGYKVYGSDGTQYDRRSTKKLNPYGFQTFPVKDLASQEIEYLSEVAVAATSKMWCLATLQESRAAFPSMVHLCAEWVGPP